MALDSLKFQSKLDEENWQQNNWTNSNSNLPLLLNY